MSMSKLKVGDLVESIMTSKIGIVIEIYQYNNSMLRVFMVFKQLNRGIEVKPQEIKSFNRTGFSVIEWGGTELK